MSFEEQSSKRQRTTSSTNEKGGVEYHDLICCGKNVFPVPAITIIQHVSEEELNIFDTLFSVFILENIPTYYLLFLFTENYKNWETMSSDEWGDLMLCKSDIELVRRHINDETLKSLLSSGPKNYEKFNEIEFNILKVNGKFAIRVVN